jgi:hypothetical protein
MQTADEQECCREPSRIHPVVWGRIANEFQARLTGQNDSIHSATVPLGIFSRLCALIPTAAEHPSQRRVAGAVSDGPKNRRIIRRIQPCALCGFGALHASVKFGRYPMSTVFLETAAARDEGAESSVEDLAGLVRAEYDEMPGLVLTCPQLRRLFGFDPPTCDAVVRELVEASVLVRRPNGSYATRRALMLRREAATKTTRGRVQGATAGFP